MSIPQLNYKELTDAEKKAKINLYHWDKKISIFELAKHWNTYSNKITRDCQRLGIPYRNKSEAQKVSLETGKNVHPTEGRERTPEEKEKIGDAKRESWKNLSKKEMNEIKKARKKSFKGFKNEHLRVKNFRAASTEGSKLEKFLYTKLKENYTVSMHKEMLLMNDKFHIDLFLPTLKLAIEIDGPSHFENIWGHDKLAEVKEKDNRKSGLILDRGLRLIRVVNDQDFSESFGRAVIREIEEIIQKIRKDEKIKKISYIKV